MDLVINLVIGGLAMFGLAVILGLWLARDEFLERMRRPYNQIGWTEEELDGLVETQGGEDE